MTRNPISSDGPATAPTRKPLRLAAGPVCRSRTKAQATAAPTTTARTRGGRSAAPLRLDPPAPFTAVRGGLGNEGGRREGGLRAGGGGAGLRGGGGGLLTVRQPPGVRPALTGSQRTERADDRSTGALSDRDHRTRRWNPQARQDTAARRPNRIAPNQARSRRTTATAPASGARLPSRGADTWQ